MTTEQNIKKIFSEKYSQKNWKKLLNDLFSNIEIFENRNSIENNNTALVDEVIHLGNINLEETNINREIAIYEVILKKEIILERNRVGLRNLLKDEWQNLDGAFIVYHYPDQSNWRFTFVSEIFEYDDMGERIKLKTESKRYTYILGENESVRTATERFFNLANKIGNRTLKDIMEAFSVEKVSEEFFEKYKKQYEEFNKFLQNKINQSQFTEKDIRDFTKKLLGRIVFLYFVQKKGWLGATSKEYKDGDLNFIRNLFIQNIGKKRNFYSKSLSTLFFESLNKERNEDVFEMPNGHNVCVPFLNGGLFEQGGLDENKIEIDNKLFEGLFDFFDQYNFTIYEDDENDHTVGIDPEMLGHIFENLLEDNKDKGTFYTPKEIVHYMCQESLFEYIFTKLDSNETEKELIDDLVKRKDISESNDDFLNKVEEALDAVKICDPAVGSGAFPMGLLKEIYNIKNIISHNKEYEVWSPARVKEDIIQNSIYGVDIEKGAIDIARLRFWLSLIVDEDEPKPLPNLDFKLMQGNSLIENVENGNTSDAQRDTYLYNLNQLKKDFFHRTSHDEKVKIKNDIENLNIKLFNYEKEIKINKIKNIIDDLTALKFMDNNISNNDKKKINKLELEIKEIKNSTLDNYYFEWHKDFSEIFDNGGFDIVIGNPPYVSTKGIDDKYKKILKKVYGFADDLYSHFYFKSVDILKENIGILSFITSKTFWTIQSKENLRQLLQKNKILQIYDTAAPFEAAMVDTCVVTLKKEIINNNYELTWLDGRNDLLKPIIYKTNINIFKNAINQAFFCPTSFNLQVYNKYNVKVSELLEKWWEKIETSEKISKNSTALLTYRNSLKAGDVVLLGTLTDGGVGLQTANNGKFVGVRDGTNESVKIKLSRIKKLIDANKVINKSIYNDENYFLGLTEHEIWKLFDELKEKHGRNIFGRGYIFRIVKDEEIADVDKLSEDEKRNGIDKSKPYFIPYHKGDRDGNRWWLETPFVINWSKGSVSFLKTNSGKKGNGMPVVRNSQFNFLDGFSWNLINGTRTSNDLKFKLINKTVNDVGGMKLFSISSNIPDWYIVTICNSKFINYYTETFINFTVNFQLNDVRQIPLIIPTEKQLTEFKIIFDEALEIKKKEFSKIITEQEAEESLNVIQNRLDEKVYKLYDLTPKEIKVVEGVSNI